MKQKMIFELDDKFKTFGAYLSDKFCLKFKPVACPSLNQTLPSTF